MSPKGHKLDPVMTAASSLGRSSHTEMLVLAEKARSIRDNLAWMMVGYVSCAWVLAWFLYDEPKARAIAVWLVTVTLMAAFNVWGGARMGQRKPKPQRAPQHLRLATHVCLFFGVLWAAGVWILWPADRLDSQVFLMFITSGLTTGALLALCVHLPAYYGFFLPCMLGLIAVIWHEGEGLISPLIAVAILAYFVTSLRFVKILRENFIGLMRSRFEVTELAESLQRQKEVAEAASQSKSRFLAAASHDLRQPVHSLSLFAGALAQHPLPPQSDQLVKHLQTTIASLGAMFDALLNISKLDAGTVQTHCVPLQLARLLHQSCEGEAKIAHDKGIELLVDSPAVWIQSDPSLLERIVRNLVSNAVQHTEQGRVAVRVRTIAGKVVLRIADTGIGIPADKLDEVFDEFVQLHNPERDRNNGLGIGLAIVRRLTALLNIQLRLRSRVGRGTVFSLSLGAAVAAPAKAEESTGHTRSTADMKDSANDALVIVIDDDLSIREAMAALLTGWGYQVVLAGGLEEFLPTMVTLSKVPLLLICDLRLRQGENGIETVEYLRSQYNDDLPAILVTGDTAPEPLQQAQQSGFVLLHKPVSPESLRTAIAEALAN